MQSSAVPLQPASATVGPIFPPSIPMVIYAMLSGASIGKLFMGGMVPGVLLAILLMIYVAFISHKRNYPAGVVMSKREFRELHCRLFRHCLQLLFFLVEFIPVSVLLQRLVLLLLHTH